MNATRRAVYYFALFLTAANLTILSRKPFYFQVTDVTQACAAKTQNLTKFVCLVARANILVHVESDDTKIQVSFIQKMRKR